ncbi:MAG: PDZ domain-containing protein [Blastocatellia bacterium]|nr:PDZ domain-containing protein [Blastocatellia bacterium]
MERRFNLQVGTRAIRLFVQVIAFSILIAYASGTAAAQSPEPIRYILRFPSPHTHYVEVEATVPTGGRSQVELMMAVWTPGSYLMREYARNVDTVSARAPEGRPLGIDKSRKNRWIINTGGAASITVAYRLYCHEMGVRTNWVDGELALLNGAATFLTLVERGPRRHEVRLILPSEWRRTMTGLPSAPGGAPNHYVAEDFDTLVDSPIVAGNPNVYEFDVDGKRHYLVNTGDSVVWDGPRSARDVEKIVRAARSLWGFLPYEKYVFLNMIVEAGGGLEHKNSTVMMTSRWATRTDRAYKRWLGLVSHEYVHVWNVKRLRPIELGPFDYETEVYTRSLWISEGLTSYYGDLLLSRAKLITQNEYLTALSTDIEQLQNTPGRLVQPVEESSYDAWIKGYRPNENTPNTQISYYTKGAIIGFLLDARIRRSTNGAKSLDDVMRLAYQRYAGNRGFTAEEFRRTASEVAGTDLRGWFVKALETTEELDYTEALEWFGLQFRKGGPPRREGGPENDGPPDAEGARRPERAWLGLIVRPDDGRLVVIHVRRGTPGYDAGFNVGDEILAVGDYRVRPEQWASRMEQYKPGDRVSVLVARRDRLMRIDSTFGKEPERQWRLAVAPNASEQQKARLKVWLGQ